MRTLADTPRAMTAVVVANEVVERTINTVGRCANRGTLHGVYGLTNPVGDTASDALWARATRAWTLAKTGVDAAAGCKFFGCPTDGPWFHKHGFTAVKTIGQITFYKL